MRDFRDCGAAEGAQRIATLTSRLTVLGDEAGSPLDILREFAFCVYAGDTHAAYRVYHDLARALLPLRALVAAGGVEAALARGASAPERPLRDVERLVSSARLRRRLGGEGRIDPERLRRSSVGGPVARASGLAVDARSEDERYRRLDFASQLDDDGDALARVRVRVREVRESLRLLVAVAADPESARSATPSPRVEGPRGPLHVDGGGGALVAHAPGTEQLRNLAGETIGGLELASATAVLTSFDLSPWAVDG